MMPSFWNIDKLFHAAEYFVLGWLLMRTCFTSPSQMFSRFPALSALTMGLLFAVSDEWHQYYVPGRSAEIFDVLFDFLGIVIAIFIYPYLLRYDVSFIGKVNDKTGRLK